MNKKIQKISLLSLMIILGCQNSNLIKNTNINSSSNSLISSSKFLPNNKKTELHGTISFPKTRKEEVEAFRIKSKSKFNTKANVSDIAPNATISFILPENNNVIATGLSDSNGAFTISLNAVNVNGDFFNPEPNRVYILEASKRIGSSGNNTMAIRTFVRWNGTYWDSITDSELRINEYTTAYTIIQGYNISTITPESTIAKIQVNGNVLTPLAIGSISIPTINSVVGMVTSILSQSKDPVAFVKFNNGVFMSDQSDNIASLTQQSGCSGCDLSQVDLSKISLEGKDLSFSNLSGKDLSNVDLTDTILVGADLRGAILPNDLSYLDLSETKLTTSDLKNGTVLKNLTGTNLSYADLTGIDLSGVSGTLSDLTKTRLTGCNFKNANLQYTNLKGVHLFEATFENTKIKESDLTNADLTAVDLSGIFNKEINNLILVGTNLTGANLSNLDLTTIKNKDMTGTLVSGITMENAILSGIDLSNKNFFQANLSGVKFFDPSFALSNPKILKANFRNADLSKANLQGLLLNDLNFTNCDLSEANLLNTDIFGTNFTGANLRKANLKARVSITRAKFISADLREITFFKSAIDTDFSYADMSALDISIYGFTKSAFGTGCSFIETNFDNTIFANASTGTNFSNSNLNNTIFSYKNLARVDFTNAKMSGVKMENSNCNNCSFNGATFYTGGLTPADLDNTNFGLGVDFRNSIGFKEASKSGSLFGGSVWLNGITCDLSSPHGSCYFQGVDQVL